MLIDSVDFKELPALAFLYGKRRAMTGTRSPPRITKRVNIEFTPLQSFIYLNYVAF